MKTKKSAYLRIFLLVEFALPAIACLVDNVPLTAATLEIPTLTSGSGSVTAELPSSTPADIHTPTATEVPTATESPTPEPTATPTQSSITMTAGQKLSCVAGPQWILYEWVAGIAKGESVTLLARITYEEDEYYFVRKADGTECWAFGESSTISGDPSILPVTAAPSLPKITYVIENKTGLPACDVFIRGKNETVWGADRLGAGSIAPGAKFSLDLTAGFYDVLIKDCTGGILYEKADRAIGSDSGYRYTALATKVKFYIKNNQGVDICLFRFQPVGGAWKELHTEADGHIANGAKVDFTLLVGKYNMEIHRCSDGAVVDLNSDVTIGPTTTGFNSP